MKVQRMGKRGMGRRGQITTGVTFSQEDVRRTKAGEKALHIILAPNQKASEHPVRLAFKGGIMPSGMMYTVNISPLGAPGDRLFVKETFAYMCGNADPRCNCAPDEESAHYIEYRADTENPYPGDWPEGEAKGNPDAPKWRSSTTMPRGAARFWFEIKKVEILPVQDVSEEMLTQAGYKSFGKEHDPTRVPRAQFTSEWDARNAKKGLSYSENPYVIAYTLLSS